MSDYIPQFYVDVIVYTFKIKFWFSTSLLEDCQCRGCLSQTVLRAPDWDFKAVFLLWYPKVTSFLVGQIFLHVKAIRIFTRFGSWADEPFVVFEMGACNNGTIRYNSPCRVMMRSNTMDINYMQYRGSIIKNKNIVRHTAHNIVSWPNP